MGGSLLVGRPPSARPAHQQTPEHSSSAFSNPHQKPPLHCRCGRLVGGPSVFFLPSLLLSPLFLRKSFPEKFSGKVFRLSLYLSLSSPAAGKRRGGKLQLSQQIGRVTTVRSCLVVSGVRRVSSSKCVRSIRRRHCTTSSQYSFTSSTRFRPFSFICLVDHIFFIRTMFKSLL